MAWDRVLPEVWRFRDSCNVYAVRGPEGLLVVDAGSGAWLADTSELPASPVALACTHYSRDHSAGAVRASRAGIPVWVPEAERAVFADPLQHFRQRETYIIYDNLWDLYAPIEGVPVAGVLKDYDTVSLAGLPVEVIPLPGATLTQVGLAVTLPSGARVAFCGEAIHSPGRLARLAPLQYNYNDLGGTVQCIYSARALRASQLEALLPSLGEPMVRDVDGALSLLEANLRAMLSLRPGCLELLGCLEPPGLRRVTEHVWLDTQAEASSWYLASRSSKVLALDYGYHRVTVGGWPGYPKPERRRVLLHGLEGLRSETGVGRIDAVLPSHYHDDHVAGIPLLQRLYGTECWAPEVFADLLEEPAAHCFPCCWPHPCRVGRRLRADEPFRWEEYTFHIHPMNGHTRFSALIGFEADGKRFAHTGDQYFFEPWEADMRDFARLRRAQNHVYRNGAHLDGYEGSGRWMKEWRPDIVLQGHQKPMITDDAFFDHLEAWDGDYAGLHRDLMPLGGEEAHFGLDSWGGWVWPYRVHRLSVEPFRVRVTVRNPFPRETTLQVALVGPQGWSGESTTLRAPPRGEVSSELGMRAPGPCRRQPIAVELASEGQLFGQVAEALVTLGEPEW